MRVGNDGFLIKLPLLPALRGVDQNVCEAIDIGCRPDDDFMPDERTEHQIAAKLSAFRRRAQDHDRQMLIHGVDTLRPAERVDQLCADEYDIDRLGSRLNFGDELIIIRDEFDAMEFGKVVREIEGEVAGNAHKQQIAHVAAGANS